MVLLIREIPLADKEDSVQSQMRQWIPKYRGAVSGPQHMPGLDIFALGCHISHVISLRKKKKKKKK